MHELGIASSILECVQTEAARRPNTRITKVGVKIGELAGVDRDALQFGFEVLVKDTEWEPVALELEYVPRMQRCSQCVYDFRMTDFDPRCPLCGECSTQCISGEELDIAYMEVEEWTASPSKRKS
jgi:hydrogenase nickel incorporation protein HypA/HybF